ncbi:MAG: flagellar motor switch protein FliN [Gammaproteobacteria bacterium]|nr:flagellar motor switch protein FliN [Gammaproteobacteria bacterium]
MDDTSMTDQENGGNEAVPVESPEGGKEFQAAAFQEVQQPSAEGVDEQPNLDVIMDVPVTLSLEVGRTKMSVGSLLRLRQGSVVELDRLAGEPLDVLVNGQLIAQGEIVVVNDKFGIRLVDVVSPLERLAPKK